MKPSTWREQALALIHKAVLAPSSHNTQPWLFRVSMLAIDVLADRTRALPVNDPDDRELTISCGCALANLQVAAAGQGLRPQVTLLPDPGDPDWLARVAVTDDPAATADADLAPFIERRHTYRKPFELRAVEAIALERLVAAAAAEGATFRPLVADEAKAAAAELVAAGDAAQWADPSWRRELAAWMHPRRRGDGLTVPTLAVPVAQAIIRTFDVGGGVGAKDQQLAIGSPLLAVLTTPRDDPGNWMRAGLALERLLLTACKHQLQASYLNQPIEVASLRSGVQRLAGGDGFPQILLRLGHPLELTAGVPRRPLDEVIEWQL